jgi:predicted lipase
MLPAAAAAYTAMDPAATIPLPAGFTLMGRIQAGGVATHPLAQKVIAESSIFGYVATNAATNTALVAIRGTRTLDEWFSDFDALPSLFMANPKYGFVHDGFNHVYAHIRQSINSYIGGRVDGPACSFSQLLITGHSLGGALTTLAGLDWSFPVTRLVTIAGPRALTPESLAHFDVQSTRVVNFLDVVPQVPEPPLYEHAGEQLWVNSGGPWDPKSRHGLIAYEAGLKKLMPMPLAA